MPDDIKNLYNESRDIVNQSPKSAAALLRLALQKLIIYLGESGENLYKDIGNLIKKKKLPSKIQKSLDSVRILGNESVHPGTINLDDEREAALLLFKLINIIVEYTITQPKEIDKLYEMIPETKKNSIKKRNNNI